MTLAWELEHLRQYGKKFICIVDEYDEYLKIIENIKNRFQKIEKALR